MNYRIQQFLTAENLTQSQFADCIGVARASVSHIIAGRNKPGFDFIESMALKFPTLNLEWLITGKGKMYKETSAQEVSPTQIFEPEEATLFSSFEDIPVREDPPKEITQIVTEADKTQPADNKLKITKIIAFFSNGTFQELENRY